MTETTRTAVRAAVAASLAILGSQWFTANRPYWTILIAVVVLNDTWGSSLRKTWQRVGMTAAGCAAGWALHFVSHGNVAFERAMLLVAVFAAAFFRKSSYPWMTFFITVYVAFLFTVLGQWSAGLMLVRLVDSVAGGLIAIVALMIVPAPRVARRLEEQLSSFWKECRAQVEQGFAILAMAKAPHDDWRSGRRELLRQVEQLQTWARETDYETFPRFRSVQRNRRIFRNTVLLCHHSLGFNRMARLHQVAIPKLDGLREETLRRFDLLRSATGEEREPLEPVEWPEYDGDAAGYFGRRVDELLGEIYRDL